jgi:hypothetical protein
MIRISVSSAAFDAITRLLRVSAALFDSSRCPRI